MSGCCTIHGSRQVTVKCTSGRCGGMAVMWREEVGAQVAAMRAARRGSKRQRTQAARRCQARERQARRWRGRGGGGGGLAAVRLTSSRRGGGDGGRHEQQGVVEAHERRARRWRAGGWLLGSRAAGAAARVTGATVRALEVGATRWKVDQGEGRWRALRERSGIGPSVPKVDWAAVYRDAILEAAKRVVILEFPVQFYEVPNAPLPAVALTHP
jgi:hypothetical protein